MRTRLGARLVGPVQGVGFRPFARGLARARGVAGWARNEGGTVRVEVEADEAEARSFLEALAAEGPGGAASIRDVSRLAPLGDQGFALLESAEGAGGVPAIPPDLAPCPGCLAEVEGDGRRAGYPFTSCTRCGPRWSVARSAPWDRARTAMAPWTPCAACRAEHAPGARGDRREHAETLACPACGPTLWLERAGGASGGGGERLADGPRALDAAAEALRGGAIVALAGVGGWQLAVDAGDDAAVRRLRARKGREAKPFAVLFGSLGDVERVAVTTPDERALLASAAAPIVLVRRRDDDGALAPAVAPGLRTVGAMLPASPLHALLVARAGGPLVCTSGNLAGEPLAVEPGEARARLGPVADLLLGHDRAIVRPLDDSVLRASPRGPIALRRARGFAPRALPRGEAGPVVLALGAHLKATVTLGFAGEWWVSEHVGDLDGPAARARLARTAREQLAWAGVRPDAIACDLHPEAGAALVAEVMAEELGVPLVRVGHHAAHVAAVAAEHALTGPVLGFAWDGFGLGEDGGLWGGETIALDGPHARRVAHLRPFPLPGGEAAHREPRRAALGLLWAAGLGTDALAERFEPGARERLVRALDRGVRAPPTSSVGRLFDAVAALLGLPRRAPGDAPAARCFEGEAAQALEELARGSPAHGLPLPWSGAVLDWGPLVRAVVAARGEVPAGALAAGLHAALAGAVGAAVSPGADVVLSGGCFQNALLAGWAADAIERAGARPWLARALPPGDGGLSLGQALLASRRLSSVSRGPG